jgi:hypothetical protein
LTPRLRRLDEALEPKPKLGEDTKPWWGGYELRFKLIDRSRYETLKGRPDKLRMGATVTGPKQERTFTVDLSKCEYTVGKAEQEFDHFTIFVYTPEMIVIEKLRAICQQMADYPHRGRPTARYTNWQWERNRSKSLNLSGFDDIGVVDA